MEEDEDEEESDKTTYISFIGFYKAGCVMSVQSDINIDVDVSLSPRIFRCQA